MTWCYVSLFKTTIYINIYIKFHRKKCDEQMRRIIFKKRGCIYRWYNQHIKGGRVWRYQMGNQNPYIEEEQTAQWPKEKGQKDKHRSRIVFLWNMKFYYIVL